MRVFLSWSGDVSHKVACVLKEWLPSVIQSIRPYVSSQDIDKGARWSSDIAKELQEATFGILCVTRANIEAPWINFEAGALSKTIDRSSVAPFLFDIKRSEVQGPLLQFQSTVNEQEDLFKLLLSLNNAMLEAERLEDAPLKKSFDVWWPELEKSLAAIAPSEEKARTVEKTGKLAHSEAILEEILELTRSQQRLLRTPEELFPPGYLVQIIRENSRTFAREHELRNTVHRMRKELSILIEGVDKFSDRQPAETGLEIQRVRKDIEMLVKRCIHMLSEFEASENSTIHLPVRRFTIKQEKRQEENLI